jgi:hypothetical protein
MDVEKLKSKAEAGSVVAQGVLGISCSKRRGGNCSPSVGESNFNLVVWRGHQSCLIHPCLMYPALLLIAGFG